MMLGLLALAIGQMRGPPMRRLTEAGEQLGDAAEFTLGALIGKCPGGLPGTGVWEACGPVVREVRCQA